MSIYTSSINRQRAFKTNRVILSFVLAIILSLISSNNMVFYNPLWIVLFLIYWHIRIDIKESYNNLYYAFILGIICDLIFSKAIGISAISYLIISYILSTLKPKIYFYTLLQITVMVFMLLLINQTVFLLYSLYFGVINNFTKVVLFSIVSF